MNELPTPEEFFNGKLPEDDVTPDKFEEAVGILVSFTQVNPQEIQTMNDLVKATRELGFSIRNIVLSCGVIQDTPFSYISPKISSRGDALIAAGDFELGNIVKNQAETSLLSRDMIIRTNKADGSSTASPVSANQIGSWDEQLQYLTNHRLEGTRSLSNYYAYIPVNMDIDQMTGDSSVVAVDFRAKPTRIYYPLRFADSETELQGYTRVARDLCLDLLQHLRENNYV